MKLLLDTHVFLWYVTNDRKMPVHFAAEIRDPANDVYLSSVSQWEATIKFELGRLPLPQSPNSYFPLQRRKHKIKSLAVSEASVCRLDGLPRLHRDPFDRILVAQAIAHRCTIVTVDPMIQQYPVQTL